jgi:uncharacterized membrane protein
MNAPSLARALGWTSLAIGGAELIATSSLRSFLGAGNPSVIRLFGIRECVSGVAVLALPDPTPAIASRIAGDALDIASLVATLRRPEARQANVTLALANVLTITALDVWALVGLRAGKNGGASGTIQTRKSITIGRPADELHRLWTDPETFPRLGGPDATIKVSGPDEHQWEVELGRGHSVSWTTRTLVDEPGQRVVWSTAEHDPIQVRGETLFRPAPAGWGTEVTLVLDVTPPHGIGGLANRMGGFAARLGGIQLLHRFKSLAETGEVPTIVGQPAARDSGRDLRG